MAGSEPFSYEQLFAKRSSVAAFGPSRYAKYDFAVAKPDPDTLPLDGLAEAVKVALDRDGRSLAQYPDTAGLTSLRELVAEKLGRDRNMKVTPNDVVLSVGSGQAIDMVIQTLTDPGDTVLMEEFVYTGTLNQAYQHGANVVGVKCDNRGIIPEELEATLKGFASQGVQIKFLYTIPTHQNPLGWTMPLERRQSVLDITREYGVPVFEDDCYVDLRYEGEDVTSFYSLDDTGQVVYVASFSKILGPGLRMGYLVAPREVLQRAVSFKSRPGPNQLAALTVEEYMRHNMYQHIDEQNASLRIKRDAMLASLGENFGDSATWSRPEGGLFIWLQLAEGVDLAGFQEQAFAEGVGYLAGPRFSPESRGANCARLCFGYPSAEENYEGIAQFARILERHGMLRR